MTCDKCGKPDQPSNMPFRLDVGGIDWGWRNPFVATVRVLCAVCWANRKILSPQPAEKQTKG